jgi:ABC-type Fe3+-siderophore transport system permease subunit
LGELDHYYTTIPIWDTLLHTLNGFLFAAVGFVTIDLLNRNSKNVKLSPLYLVMVAFCFSMTIGVLWEFFEFFMDVVFHSDMQKDTLLQSVTSILLNPEGRNLATTVAVDSLTLNEITFNGYIDIGLYDTMQDLFVNFIGAVIFSIIGYFYTRNRDKIRFLKHLIPRKKENPKDS